VTALIGKIVEENLLSNLAGITTKQRLSIYADDIHISTLAHGCRCTILQQEIQELQTVKEIVNIFGEAMGSRLTTIKPRLR
jgi:hypothetical protein